MLSVLIPTYNYNAFSLVKEIHEQLSKTTIAFEIICFDDASKSPLNLENDAINTLTFASFKTLENNLGRSAIRNLLAKTAKYNWLLFLDADVAPVTNHFIEKYIACLQEKETVFCGGTKYKEDHLSKKLLRYKYGKKHEQIAIDVRKKQGDKYFFTSNFLIEKSVFTSVLFNEDLVNYGYEDLFFAKKLQERKIKINHLENEIYHLGIDDNMMFVEKTILAIENLTSLLKNKQLDFKDTNITAVYLKIKKLNLTFLLNFQLKKMVINTSSLFLFNLFRLSILHQTFKNS